MRLSGALAALLGRAEEVELPEDELLGRLREWGLITYPSPLLGGLLEKLPEVLAAEVLPRLDPTDCVLFGRVGRACRAAVVSSGAPQEVEEAWLSHDEGTEGRLLLRVKDFVGSVEDLAWAMNHGRQWVLDEMTCSYAAEAGRLEVLKWARAHDCPWNERVTTMAGAEGHLEVLKWAREQGCPWHENTRDLAAGGGHLEVLKWARAQDPPCPWDEETTVRAALTGNLEILQWARAGVQKGRSRRAPGGSEVGAGQRMPVGRGHLRSGRATGDVEMGAGAPVPVGPSDAPQRRSRRTPGAVAVGGGARCSLRCTADARVASDAPGAALCSGGR